MVRKVVKTKKNTDLIVETFATTAQVVASIMERPLNRAYEKDTPNRDELRTSWHGVDCIEDAVSWLQNGWSDKIDSFMQDLQKMSKHLKLAPKKPKFVSQVQGYVVNVPNYLRGLPNSMIDMKLEPKKQKVVTVTVDATVPARIETDDILKWGAKLTAAIMNLERNGFRVRVDVMYVFGEPNDGKNIMALKYNVKHEGNHFDIKRMMFPLAHPAMFRAIGFDWEERVPGGSRRSGKGQALWTWSSSHDEYKQWLIKNVQDDDKSIYVCYETDFTKLFSELK